MSHEILYTDSRNQITVSVEGYRRIMALIEHYKVCHACEQSYTEHAPEVVRNSCARCFLAHQKTYHHRVFTFLGARDLPWYGGKETKTGYLFLNAADQAVYVTYRWYDVTDTRDRFGSRFHVSETLRHWNFPVPTTHAHAGEAVYLHDEYFTVQGDFTSFSVILLSYRNHYADVSVDFLVERGGRYHVLNRRTKEGQKLIAEARKRAEARKDASGMYVTPEGYHQAELRFEHLHTLVAQIASERHDQAAQHIQTQVASLAPSEGDVPIIPRAQNGVQLCLPGL